MITVLSRNPNLTLSERHAGRAAEVSDAVESFATGIEAAAAAEIAAAVESFTAALEAAITEAATVERSTATTTLVVAIAAAGEAAMAELHASVDALVIGVAAAAVGATAQLVAATRAVVIAVGAAGAAAADAIADATDTLVIALASAAVLARATDTAAAKAAAVAGATDRLIAGVVTAGAAVHAAGVASAADALLVAVASAGRKGYAQQVSAATDALIVALSTAGSLAADRAWATDTLLHAVASAATVAAQQSTATQALLVAIGSAGTAAVARAAATDTFIAGVAAAGAARDAATSAATDAFVAGATAAISAAATQICAATDSLIRAVASAGSTGLFAAAGDAAVGAAIVLRGTDRFAAAIDAALGGARISAAADALLEAIAAAALTADLELLSAVESLIDSIAAASLAARIELGVAIGALGKGVAAAAVAAATDAFLTGIEAAGAARAAVIAAATDAFASAIDAAIAGARVSAATDVLLRALAAAAHAARGELRSAVSALIAGLAAAAQAAPAVTAPQPAVEALPAEVGASAPRRRIVYVRRAVNALLGSSLLIVYLLSSIVAIASILLLLNGGTSSAVFRTPDGPFFHYVAAALTVALVAIALRYVYFYICWFDSRRHFGHPKPVDVEVLRSRELPYMKFQVTTKGGALPVVERSLRSLEAACDKHWWLRSRLSVEVITEVESEAKYLERTFRKTSLRVTALCLPADYRTPNGTGLKARALHYMVEQRREGFNAVDGRSFIVHLDEETLITEPHLLVLINYLSGDPRPVSQGPIYYPLEWEKTPWICRAIESTRPFGCSECARVMQHPPPPHLHGSNLVVDEAVENEIGWDFGKLEGNAFIAEDLLFGLRAYAVVGEEAFGWHGATMLEQPPLSLHWAIQQRLRWVLGALQGLRAMWRSEAFSGISLRHKLRLHTSIAYRIATYAGGFPVGLTGLVFLLHPLTEAGHLFNSGVAVAAVRAALLFAAFGWVVSYQIGLTRNLRYQDITRSERARQMGIALLITPITGLCETVGPFIALVRWLFGVERVSWTPTPKLAKEDVSVAAIAVVRQDTSGSAA